MEEDRRQNRNKFESLTETMLEFKEEFKTTMRHQQKVNNSILDAIAQINRQMKEMQEAQKKISDALLKVSDCNTPNSGVNDNIFGTQERIVAYDSSNTEADNHPMEYSMTDLKRRRDRIIEQEVITMDKTQYVDDVKKTIQEMLKPKRLYKPKSSGRPSMESSHEEE